MQLHQKHSAEVACFTFNMDYAGAAEEPPEAVRDSVLKTLTEIKANFQNVISSDPDETVYDALDLGSVPAVLIYDRNGKLQKRFDNDKGEYGETGFNYEHHVIPYVEQLLANEHG
ncbi:MAG: hypothetical protein ACC628_28105 [Pirellulaceae bacterium]